MNLPARRVINVSPNQVIGPPRRKRQRSRMDPRLVAFAHDPVNWGSWFGTAHTDDLPNAPTQLGFGHMDTVAREMKQ